MHSEQPKPAKRPRNAERPFPWRCRDCGQERVVPTTISYDAEVSHDGRLHAFAIPSLTLPVCQACGAKVFTEKVEDQITAALRSYLRFLTPDAMRAALDRVQMTQKEVAERLGIAEATLSRWLNETQIQTRAMDNLLRVFFAFPEVRSALRGEAQDPGLGTTDITEHATRDRATKAGPANRVATALAALGPNPCRALKDEKRIEAARSRGLDFVRREFHSTENN